ncbi:MAG TPA: Uma2 family endonuclease [Tepidisphaeraceae bacterium]|nr:Uma2 family endonuclease [Tepidisphaeraceae bacterium]
MTFATLPNPPDAPTEVETLADLLEQLGVPPERVWLRPAPGTATEADIIYADDHLDRLCELIDGTMVEKAMGTRESLIATVISSLLYAFVLPRKLGFVVGADSMFRLFPGQVRMPDVAFISLKRLPSGIATEPIAPIAPELAVEVLSASNTPQEMKRKRREYFNSGVQLLWLVDPNLRTIDVYTAPENPVRRQVTDALDGGVVLPGFSVPVADLFSMLDLRTDDQSQGSAL